jgi:small subunit ribosomal protein S6
MKLYETVFIARQDLTNAQVETLANTFTSVIKTHGGEVSKTEFCGLRNLAYKIKKNKKGHYTLMNISCEPAGILEMERQMKLNEDILRHLTIRVDALDPNPSKLMQRTYHDDRYQGLDDRDEGSAPQGSDHFADKKTDQPFRPRYTAPVENEGDDA